MIVNASVFVLVLIVFSVAVFWSVTHTIDNDKRERLRVLSDALISSIEPPDEAEPDDDIPDIVQMHNDFKEEQTAEVILQWFDDKGKLLAQKGLLDVTVPFDKSATFQKQNEKHALLLTRPVEREGHLLGYLRVGIALADADSYKRNLLIGLGTGTVLALIVSSIAIVWLVKKALEPVESSIQKLSEFTGDASHELKSPIMAIKTNAAVALKYSDGLSDKHRQNIEMMLDAANQMDRTVADLLSLAESENAIPESSLVPINIASLFDELCEELKILATTKDIELECKTDDPSLSIKARKEDLRLILGNVCKNAIAYSSAGSTVFVHARRAGNKTQFTIRDTGIGISEEELPQIFDRFWRSDKARSYTSGGNGLGLAIVKSIVERYQGAIAVKSKLGTGTTVTITFNKRR